MHHTNSCHDLEQLARQLDQATNSSRSKANLARIGFCIGDEFGDRLGGKRGMHHLDKRPTGDARHRCNITDDVEAQLVIECRIDCVRRVSQQKRVAVG